MVENNVRPSSEYKTAAPPGRDADVNANYAAFFPFLPAALSFGIFHKIPFTHFGLPLLAAMNMLQLIYHYLREKFAVKILKIS